METQEILCATISWKDHGNSVLDSGAVLLLDVLLLHDNAPAHKSCTSQAAIRKCGFIELNHPPYGLDLATSDYFPFRNHKKFLHQRRFAETVQSRKLQQGGCLGGCDQHG